MIKIKEGQAIIDSVSVGDTVYGTLISLRGNEVTVTTRVTALGQETEEENRLKSVVLFNSTTTFKYSGPFTVGANAYCKE